MPLTIWKRHSATCLKTAALQKLKLEDKRFYKKCRCACWVTGVHPLTGEALKQSLNTTSWEAAETLKHKLETNTPDAIEKQKTTIKDAFKAWFTDKQELKHVAEITIENMYTGLEIKVLKFAEDRGITLLSQLDDDATRDLLLSPIWLAWGSSTRDRQFVNLHSFFKYGISRRWITTNPADAVHYVRSRREPVDPYTPEEADRLEAAFGNWTERVDTDSRKWCHFASTLHCLKHVLDDTGLRISDAQQIRPAIIDVEPNGHGTCTLLQTKSDSDCAKSDGEVTVYLKPETLAEMARVPWLSPKYPFMLDCDEQRPDETDKQYRARFKAHLTTESKKVYYAMRIVGKVAGVKNCRPHRFRHTFAVRLLENGWDISDVSRLLGHKEIGTTEKHYAKWNNRRQKKLGDRMISQREAEASVTRMPQGDERKVG